MDRAIDVWKGEGGAQRPVASKLVHGPRHHGTLWIVVLYAITIVMVLAFVAKLY